MYVKPWSSESERILRRLVKNGKAYTPNNTLTRTFGRKYPELIDNNFLDIGRIDKKKESIIATRENVVVVPKPSFNGGPQSKFPKFHFYKIF